MSDDQTDNIGYGYQIDVARSACLCDVGGAYFAGVGIDVDGTERLALFGLFEDPPGVRYDHACRGVAHEQVGPLPASWRRRIHGDPRCGAPTAAGRPCRAKVMEPGDVCALHRRCESCGHLIATGDHSGCSRPWCELCGHLIATGHHADCPRFVSVSAPPVDDPEAR
jgi:hypothetical protein